jgi:hypothetical protein
MDLSDNSLTEYTKAQRTQRRRKGDQQKIKEEFHHGVSRRRVGFRTKTP